MLFNGWKVDYLMGLYVTFVILLLSCSCYIKPIFTVHVVPKSKEYQRRKIPHASWIFGFDQEDAISFWHFDEHRGEFFPYFFFFWGDGWFSNMALQHGYWTKVHLFSFWLLYTNMFAETFKYSCTSFCLDHYIRIKDTYKAPIHIKHLR